jgi:hypothetical protein
MEKQYKKPLPMPVQERRAIFEEFIQICPKEHTTVIIGLGASLSCESRKKEGLFARNIYMISVESNRCFYGPNYAKIYFDDDDLEDDEMDGEHEQRSHEKWYIAKLLLEKQ